ncbi:PilZ domain-containing protein [uncultured Azohydromonas sp.]|uniref:PilZ domain-containing protein n=1 Tax=uncultured Azohydromonas sp. TaxID=487342 RepID=UPI00263915BE|nr:PilZ domain-containing protein [uncultured Azohydromonas sp.]
METRDIATWVYLGAERRQCDRKLFRCSAQLLLPDRKVQRVRTLDISVGGIGFVAPSNLLRDAVCEIKFRAPLLDDGVEMLMARGRIAYSILSGKENGFLVGLQFTEISPNAVASIRRFVNPC